MSQAASDRMSRQHPTPWAASRPRRRAGIRTPLRNEVLRRVEGLPRWSSCGCPHVDEGSAPDGDVRARALPGGGRGVAYVGERLLPDQVGGRSSPPLCRELDLAVVGSPSWAASRPRRRAGIRTPLRNEVLRRVEGLPRWSSCGCPHVDEGSVPDGYVRRGLCPAEGETRPAAARICLTPDPRLLGMSGGSMRATASEPPPPRDKAPIGSMRATASEQTTASEQAPSPRQARFRCPCRSCGPSSRG
jgi:hypothetical protein